MERISLALNSHISSFDLSSSICHEMALLASLLHLKDNCWEMRLRLLVELFLRACEDTRSPVVIESIILPCLKIWYNLIKPQENSASKKAKEKINSNLTVGSKPEVVKVSVNVYKWLEKDPNHTYLKWKSLKPLKSDLGNLPKDKKELHEYYLLEKFGRRWKDKVQGRIPPILDFNITSWVKAVLFNPSSRLARQVTCNILEHCCNSFARKEKVIIKFS